MTSAAYSPPRTAALPRTPRHLALILDGNRRWAQAHGLPAAAGYQRGGERVLEMLPHCETAGIEVVTLWPLSTANFARPAHELAPLMAVIANVVTRLAAARRWNLRLIGNTAMLDPNLSRTLDAAVTATTRPHAMTVNIAVAYEGHDEITRAISRMITDHRRAGTLDRLADGVRPQDFAAYLDTAGQPDLDLVIRTSGEQRLSGFLPWQAATAEYYFSDALWPDFDREQLRRALHTYAGRHRRFGL
ncbi:polyprenyl diphosphate synthase [Streptomyces sp. NPDC029216]|uniref:polyprenyl diphosphate synthase n=1 Tax=Streptomyces sp. NPDC029216 TaxID=3154701 RepID=UPI0033E2F32E